MSIDKDIKQDSFKNEHHKVMVNLIFTYNWTTEQLKQLFEEEGLTMQQFNILRILRGSLIPLSTLQIRERMLDKMSDSSRIVDRLIIKGLVKKLICKTDKRLVDVTITSKGLNILEKLDVKEDKMEKIVKALTKSEAKILNKLLDKIRQSN
jgi:DNA-binding MarR family transcriptional regulator